MKDLYDRASAIISKAMRDGKLALFIDGDSFRTTRPGGEWYNMVMRTRGHTFCGVYDGKCDLHWLVDDMEYMLQRSKAIAEIPTL